jgi:hypothetical protein
MQRFWLRAIVSASCYLTAVVFHLSMDQPQRLAKLMAADADAMGDHSGNPALRSRASRRS